MSSGSLSTGRELLGALVLAFQLASAVIVAVLVTRRLVARDPLLRGLVGVLLVLAQGVAVPLALGMVGLVSLPATVLVHAALLAAVTWFLRPAEGRPVTDTEADTEPVGDRRPSRATIAAFVAGVAFVGVAFYFTARGFAPFDFDTREYHIVNLAEWLQSGSIWSEPYQAPGQMTAAHPSNGEVFALWLALPTHSDHIVYLAPLAFAVLAVVAGAVAARELSGGRRDTGAMGALAIIAVLTAPVYFFSQVHSLSTDVIAAGSLLAAFALVLAARRDSDVRLVGLAGAALGLGIGAKYSAFLPGALLAGAALLLLRRRSAWWWLVPGVVAFAVPWFLRNAIATGNPLFPQAVGPLSGGESPFLLLDTSMLHHIVDGETSIVRRWLRLGRGLVGPVLVLVAVGPIAALRAKSDRTVALVTAALVIGSGVAYLATPYSGGGPTGLAFIVASCFRYGMFAVFAGVVLAAGLLGSRLAGIVLGAVFAWNLWQISGRAGSGRPDLVLRRPVLAAALIAAAVIVAVGVAVSRNDRLAALVRQPRRAVLAPLAGAAAFGLVAVGAAGVLHRMDQRLVPTELERVVAAFDGDTPVLALGVADLRSVLGPRLDRELVGVSRGGVGDELPFADENQLRRRTLGENDRPLPPAEFAVALDAAIDATGAQLLVVGGVSPLGFPDGWVPDADWCRVGGDFRGVVYVRRAVLPPTTPCTTAVAGVNPAAVS